MSQKVSPLLFNNYIYNTSKWFTKVNQKYSLNEDLQVREIINILFKNNISTQYLFVDKVIFVKYFSHVQIYVYFYCNFNDFKRNLIRSTNLSSFNTYLDIFYLYYKYIEILNIKKIEILKILRNLVYKNNVIFLYFKNINLIYNSTNLLTKTLLLKTNLNNNRNIKTKLFISKLKNKKYFFFAIKKVYHLKLSKNKKKLKTFTNKKILKKYTSNKINRFKTLHYYKTIYFLLYNLCYSTQFNLKLTISSLINLIYYELDNLDNTSKNYNFLFYNLFNLIREILMQFFKMKNCQVQGIRIQVKGRYFLTKRKRIFILNLGQLNMNNISHFKDYDCINLIKSTGSSSIKIWINYKNL